MADGSNAAGGVDDDSAIHYRDRAVYLPGADALVLADLHVGKDQSSNVQLPMGERGDLRDRLAKLVERFEPAEVVVAGDLLHAFDDVPRGVEETVVDLRDAARSRDATFVVVRGNHDAMLDAVYDGQVADEYRLADDETVVCHGHEAPETLDDVGRYVVGHDHPAIEIEGRRRPCFLHGTGVHDRTGADVLMCPAFNRLCSGTTVNGTQGWDLLSPVVTNLDAYRPVVRDEEADETLTFPPLGRFRQLL